VLYNTTTLNLKRCKKFFWGLVWSVGGERFNAWVPAIIESARGLAQSKTLARLRKPGEVSVALTRVDAGNPGLVWSLGGDVSMGG
jgi:hypothetical protein